MPPSAWAAAKFCEECGAPLGRLCVRCGGPMSVTAKYCPQCAHPAEDRSRAAGGRGWIAKMGLAVPSSRTGALKEDEASEQATSRAVADFHPRPGEEERSPCSALI